MTDIEIIPEEDDGTYEPMPEHVHEGGVLLADPVEFFDDFNAYAAMMWEGQLLVLDRDTKQWINVSPPDKKAVRKLTSVKGD